ncbi:MAG TPA: ankyrin repeat domain-containing protein [Candidatus Limnocylindria bacterium]|nr:ankyrin repeat domain-containing protein [Candidatus Limnocylindria bacterium]
MDEVFTAINARDQARLERILAERPEAARAVDENGVSALLAAAYRGNDDAVAALRGTGMDLTVFEAAAVGDLGRVRALVESDPALANAFAADGFHPLGLAAFFGHPDVVRFLIEAGADLDAPSRNRMQVTALHSAIAARDRESTFALIDAGADVNAAQQDAFTPLHEAAQNGDRDILEALLAAGAQPDVRLASGETPADLARKHKHPELVPVLEQAG